MAPPPPVIPQGMRPPDGGFGWVVAAAYALNNVIVIPIIQNFGLVFKDVFTQLNLSGTDITVIMNTSNAFGLLLGLFNGPILRTFSFRQVAIFGSLLIFIGVALTSFARSFLEFLVFYGLIMSAGQGLTMVSFSYAINSYFRARRGVAMGFAMTVTGLGPVFMPHLISLSMREYGPRSTALLLAGLSLHSTMGALLLQPVRWHLVKEEPEVKDEADKDKGDKEMVELSSSEKPAAAGAGVQIVVHKPQDEEEGVKRNGVDRPSLPALKEDGDDDGATAPMLRRRRSSAASHKSDAAEPTLWSSMASINSEGVGGSLLVLDLDAANGAPRRRSEPQQVDVDVKAKAKPPRSVLQRWLRAVATFFDLGLLRDPVYVNLMLGLSFALFAELNFSLLTPFILGDRHFNTQEIATLVSIIAVADILFRFLAPFIKKIIKQDVRVMYMIALFLLIVTRTVLIFSASYSSLVAVMVALGVAKGLRTVYWVLVIPEYVPIERLPSASGLQSVTNGMVFMALGPFMGMIRDSFGDYNYVIVAVNTMTALTVIMWSAEFAVLAVLRRRRTAAAGVADVEKSPSKTAARSA